MCQQSEMELRIEQLYLQGMPRKIGKSVENTLLKKRSCIMCSRKGDASCTCDKKNSVKSAHNGHNHTFKGDILAISTMWTRKFFTKATEFGDAVQRSTTYKILSRTTQPAHVIALGILSFVLMAVWPNILESDKDVELVKSKERKSGLTLVTYLGAFATHFGAQIWMTFVSGLSLYFALPRHTFGLCQQILFPKYFAMNSILSICTLVMFIKVIGGRWEFSSYVQVIALTTCAVIEVAVRLYLAPPLLRLMREKHKFEVSVGSGKEVGSLEQRDLVNCPHYQKIHKSFRRIHMTVAMGNLTALVCTFLHLHYLASKISVAVDENRPADPPTHRRTASRRFTSHNAKCEIAIDDHRRRPHATKVNVTGTNNEFACSNFLFYDTLRGSSFRPRTYKKTCDELNDYGN